MGEKKRNLRRFRKICRKYREEMWEIKNLGSLHVPCLPFDETSADQKEGWFADIH